MGLSAGAKDKAASTSNGADKGDQSVVGGISNQTTVSMAFKSSEVELWQQPIALFWRAYSVRPDNTKND